MTAAAAGRRRLNYRQLAALQLDRAQLGRVLAFANEFAPFNVRWSYEYVTAWPGGPAGVTAYRPDDTGARNMDGAQLAAALAPLDTAALLGILTWVNRGGQELVAFGVANRIGAGA